jgi:peptide subunit release factor 1 (eRF1)
VYAPDRAVFGGALEAEPVIGGLPPGEFGAFEPGPLLEHVRRTRLVGVLLVRLGGHASGVFDGIELVDSKVGSRLVHGRHRKGGSSARRFERRRAGQARLALEQAADTAARVLLAHRLDAVVTGGDRGAIGEVLEDPRLAPLRPLVVARVLDVPDPRLDVLRGTPELFRGARLTVS